MKSTLNLSNTTTFGDANNFRGFRAADGGVFTYGTYNYGTGIIIGNSVKRFGAILLDDDRENVVLVVCVNDATRNPDHLLKDYITLRKFLNS